MMSSAVHLLIAGLCWLAMISSHLCTGISATATSSSSFPSYPCLDLLPGWSYPSSRLAAPTPLASYCYQGMPTSLLSHFTMVRFQLDLNSESESGGGGGSGQFSLYVGDNCSATGSQYDAAAARYFSLLPWREPRQVRLPVFVRTCVGVASARPYTVRLVVRWVDYGLVAGTAGGLVLFLLADRLSRAAAFHYTSGVAVGVVGGVLIAVYLLSRLMPRRGGGAYVLLLTGWSLSIYLFQYIIESAALYAHAYRHYIVGYLSVCAVVSWAVCYRYGPVTDSRTRTLLRCALQLVGLTLVAICGNVQELAVGVALALVAGKVLPLFAAYSVARQVAAAVVRRFVPPKPRPLLTQQQFEQEAIEQTRLALAELRHFCRSPQCDAWRTMSRLSTPARFASFVAGDSHLSDDEVSQYELDYSVRRRHRQRHMTDTDTDQEQQEEIEDGVEDEFMTSDDDDT